MKPAATPADYAAAAALIPCGERIFKSICSQESRGHGFDHDDMPTMLVEPHIIWKHATPPQRIVLQKYHLAYPRQGMYPYGTYAEQPIRFDHIRQLSSFDLAVLGTSFGLTQILGENYADCGYPSPDAFAQAMWSSEAEQLKATAKLMIAKGMKRALETLDWLTIAERWNGPGNVHAYAAKLRAHYAIEH